MLYIIYTPNLGLGIALPGREREQGRFGGSIEGAQVSIEGAQGSSEGARGSIEGARGSTVGQCRGAAGGSLNWLPCTRLQLLALFMTVRQHCCLAQPPAA